MSRTLGRSLCNYYGRSARYCQARSACGIGRNSSCTLGCFLCRCRGSIAYRCRCSGGTAGWWSTRLGAVVKHAPNVAGNNTPETGKLGGEISPSICNIGHDDSRDVLDIIYDSTVFDVIENFDGVGRSSLCRLFELLWQRKCNVDDSLELLYCCLGKIRENRWCLATVKLVDKFRCVVAVFFEGLNLFAGNIRKILQKVASIRPKRPLTILLSHVSVVSISSTWGGILPSTHR